MTKEFKDYLALQGQSENTIRVYVSRIEQLLSTVSVEQLTEATINSFLLKIKSEKSGSTLNGYLHAIKAFMQFLKKEITLPTHFKTDKKLSTFFTEDYLNKTIISTIETMSDEIRLKALIYFLFYSGVRVSEIDELKRENFDLENKKVKIYVSKTKEERYAVYTKKAQEALQIYFNSEPQESNAFNISSKGIQKKFQRLKEEHFVDVDFHPHTFRHSFAMYCVSLGLSYVEISQLLGHHSLQSTMRYVNHTSTQAQNKFLEESDKRQ